MRVPLGVGVLCSQERCVGPAIALPVFLSSLPSYRTPALCQTLGKMERNRGSSCETVYHRTPTGGVPQNLLYLSPAVWLW